MPDDRPPAADPQVALPFAEAEGSRAERRNLLGLALIRVECSLELKEFMLWVFNVTHGGADGVFRKTTAEIAARPWGLCCSEATARRVVKQARGFRWLVVEETQAAHGGDGANAYAIDWSGIRETLDTSRRPGAPRSARETAPERVRSSPTPCQSARPPLQFDSPPLQFDSAFKEHPPLSLCSLPPPPPTPSGSVIPAKRSADDGAADWTAAAAALRSVGVRAVPEMLIAAQARGMAPGDVAHAVRTYRANESRFQPDGRGERVTALCRFLKAGAWPAAGVVDPDEEQADRELRELRIAEEIRRREADDEEQDACAAALEAAYGAELDGLTHAERDELAARVLGGPLLVVFRRGDRNGFARAAILEALAAERVVTEAR